MPQSANEQIDRIEEQLGKPTHRGEDYAIYHGDCMALLGRLKENGIDLTVTSPPYNIGKVYETIRLLPDYMEWCERWIQEIHRTTKPHGAFWLNLGYLAIPGKAKAVPIPYLLWDCTPFFLIQEIVWHYGAGVAAKTSFSPRNEKFLWYVKDENHYTFNLDAVRDLNVKYPNQKKHGKLKCNPQGKNPSDVWIFPKVTSGAGRSSKERTAHPAQFPITVIDRIIKACSDEGDLVLDPFLGSGSTIEAALRSNRAAVGFEIDKSYVTIAVARIEKLIAHRHREKAQGLLL